MNKFVLASISLGAVLTATHAAEPGCWFKIIEFRYLGYPALSEQDAAEIRRIADREKAEKTFAGVQAFWRNQLVGDAWNVEKSAHNRNAGQLKENVKQLNADLRAMGECHPYRVLLFLEYYPTVLESLARILNSPDTDMLTPDLLKLALAREQLDDFPQAKSLKTYADMLMLARCILQYKSQHGQLPENISRVLDGEAFRLDAWGDEIGYRTDGKNYWLWSYAGKPCSRVDLSGYKPVFRKKAEPGTIVFSGNFSDLRKQLWRESRRVFYQPPRAWIDSEAGDDFPERETPATAGNRMRGTR